MDEITSITQQIANAIGNTNEEIKLKISPEAIQSSLRATLGLSDEVVEALEDMGIDLIYHDYSTSTKTLTIQRSLPVGVPGSSSPSETPTPVETPIFTVVRKDQTYQCYAGARTSDLIVGIEDKRYYCRLLSQDLPE